MATGSAIASFAAQTLGQVQSANATNAANNNAATLAAAGMTPSNPSSGVSGGVGGGTGSKSGENAFNQVFGGFGDMNVSFGSGSIATANTTTQSPQQTASQLLAHAAQEEAAAALTNTIAAAATGKSGSPVAAFQPLALAGAESEQPAWLMPAAITGAAGLLALVIWRM